LVLDIIANKLRIEQARGEKRSPRNGTGSTRPLSKRQQTGWYEFKKKDPSGEIHWGLFYEFNVDITAK
jgi:hypothetical protein